MQDAGYRTGHIGKYHVAPEQVYRYETYMKASGRNAVAMAEKSNQFINRHSDKPFFLYFAHNFLHVPLFAPDKDKRR